MKDYKKAKFEDILADAESKGAEALSLITEMVSKEVEKVNKKGETVKTNMYSFIEIKKAYFTKYYPELLPKATAPKQKSMKAILQEKGLLK